MDKACIEKIASTLLKTPITPGDIGTKAVIAPNTASGGKQATVRTQIYTTWPSAQLTGTSSDLTQNPDPHWTVVPGEKGSITVKLLANKADPTATDPAPTHLVGSLVPGNTWVELTISGVDASDDEATRPFATTEAIRQAVARAFGTHADATKVTVTPVPGEDKYTINIPLESYPLADITVTFPEIFTTTTKAPKAEVVYHYRPVTLLHRDDSNGKPRLNQPPVSNAPHTNIRPNPVQYLRKVPNVEVLKAVKTPGNARIAGGDDINYEVTLTNPSQVTAYGLKIMDTLPVDFTHKPALSAVEVSPASLDALKAQLNWTLSDNGRTGVWPADTFNLPAGGRVTITYVATASRVVTADEAYKNVVAVPYKSLPNDTPGVETYTANGDATVRGHDVRAVTTIAPQTPLHANGKVQHGELVTTVTTLTIPNNISVPNLSVLSDLVGANLDPAKAKVTVTCPAGVTCATNPAFVPGSNGERLGVVVADQPIVNTSGQPITITIETTNLLVVDGDGPITVKADAYRGPNTPTSVDTFKPEDKASSGSSGQVEIMVPTLTLDTTLVAGHDGHNPGVPVVTPIEPGTPNLHVRFVVTNTTPGSEARGDVINVKDALEAIGLKVDPSFSSPNFDGTNLKTPAIPGDPTKPFEVFVPVIWDMGKFTGPDRPTGELRTPVVVNGQTGPLNVVPGAKDPETTGKPITANTTLALTPVYRPTPPVIPPVPGPQPQPQPQPQPTPTPTVDPSPAGDRPTEIPPAPKPPATPAPVVPGHTPSTAGPEDRATSWVDATIPAGEKAKIVLIGRDNVFADSLSSGGLQGLLDAPLLLNPVEKLSDRTKKNLDRLQPEHVIILGGPVAQSPAVEAELKQLGWNVSRVHGPTRVETAIDAAKVHAPEATDGVLARAYASNWGSGTQAFADALGGGAFAARKQRPVFLTQTGELTATLKAYLPTSKIKHLTIIGSTEAVSPAVEAELNQMGIKTTRVAGSNRAETAIKLANAQGYWNASEAESALVVNGESEDAWTDAFPAALFAKRYELPVVLSSTSTLLPETTSWLTPGATRTPPTRVVCGFSVGPVKECAFTPGTAKTNEN